MKMDWVESKIYVKPPFTGIVNLTNKKEESEMAELNISVENIEASALEAVYLQGYEDARRDFISCIENFHEEVVTQDETKNPFVIIGSESCNKCKYEHVSPWMNPCGKCKHLHLCAEKDFWTPKNETIKVGDEVVAKLPSRRDPFKAVILKEDKNDPVYQFCVIDKEGYTFWISKEDVIKTGKAFPILDMLSQLGGEDEDIN